MDPVTIILGVIIILLVYFLYLNYWKQNVLFDKVDLKQSVPSITYASLSNPGASRYSYGVWMYINSWNNANKKTIFARNTPMTNGATNVASNDFSLYLAETTPTLYCDVRQSGQTTTLPITNNFPIQKWTYLIVSVDNSILDFYLDGKLVLSTQLPANPIISTGNINMGDNNYPDIFLAKFYRWTYAMDPQTAWNEYLSGNGQSLVLPNYNVQLELLKDNVVNKQYSLF